LKKDSLNLKLIDFGLALRWDQSLRDELKKKGDKKVVGTVLVISLSLTIWHQKYLTSTMMKDVIFGAWELFFTSC
jgi:hypothetical protein